MSRPMQGSQGPAFSRPGLYRHNGCAGERRPGSSRPRGKDLLSDRIAGDLSTNAQRKVGRSPLTKPPRTRRLRWAARWIWRDPQSAQPVRGWKHVQCSQIFFAVITVLTIYCASGRVRQYLSSGSPPAVCTALHILRLRLIIRLQSFCAAFPVLISLKSPSTDLYVVKTTLAHGFESHSLRHVFNNLAIM